MRSVAMRQGEAGPEGVGALGAQLPAESDGLGGDLRRLLAPPPARSDRG